MKFAIIIPDGCADEPQEALAGATPLQAARTPAMDSIASSGIVGRANHVPPHLPAGSGDTETINLIARLSQRETDWAHRDVKRALGHWCDGYITIRGTWCEPLNSDVVRRLNRRLADVKRIAEPPAPQRAGPDNQEDKK